LSFKWPNEFSKDRVHLPVSGNGEEIEIWFISQVSTFSHTAFEKYNRGQEWLQEGS
jgi:hypothetical protein